MPAYEFDWFDAFTDVPFGGNGCAVVHDAADIPAETCMAYVRETSLSECTFVGPSRHADFHVRYFLAGREVPFAGHPTVATVASLHRRGMTDGSGTVLETGAGPIPVEIAQHEGGGQVFTMTQRAPEFGAGIPSADVAAVVGLAPEDIVGTPQIVSTGLPFCITVLKDKAALRRATMNAGALEVFRHTHPLPDGDVMEPFLVTLGGESAAGDTFSRLLLAPPNPPEDPFTGSATGCMAAYLWHHGLAGSDLIAEQGHWMGRSGQARVSVLGPPDAITGVRVGGAAALVMSGALHL